MKCIDNVSIQRYVDGETDVHETIRIERHLADCSDCARKVKQQKAFVDGIKKEIGSWGSCPDIIPEFVAPVVRRQKRRLNVTIKHYVYAVSAAGAIFLCVFLLTEHYTNKDRKIHLIYSIDGDFDANRTVSQQEMDFMIIDANGKIVP
jgi:predicted anti-sigma-YlaC factor YlaD